MDADVVIAGAGPAGLMLAAELRLGGASVVVCEKLSAPTTESRASTLHARTMEIFAERGLLPALGPAPQELTGHYGGLPLDYSGQQTEFPGQWKVPQARVEEVLGDRARGLGAVVRRRHEVRGAELTSDHVRVEINASGRPVLLTASYLVGCDGEDSTVRGLGGFRWCGEPAARRLLRADVLGLDVPDRRFERRGNGLAIASTRSGVTRIMVHVFGQAPGDLPAHPTFADVSRAWLTVTGEDISGGTPVWVNSFDDANRQVGQYRNGRILLAGDAAHQQLPVGGQALNLGLQDAVNLGWKLAAEVAGWAPSGLLDTYHQERHAIGRSVLGNIAAQSMLLLGGGEVEPFRTLLRELLTVPAVRDRLASTIGGLDIRYEAVPSPLAGSRLPFGAIGSAPGEPAGGPCPLEPLRRGRGVLLDLSGDRARLAGVAAQWAGRVDLTAVAARPGSPLDGHDTLLLRPDGYVAWAGADPWPALAHWFGAGLPGGAGMHPPGRRP